MTTARMPTIRLIDIPAVGTVIERIWGGWGWLHRDGTSSGTLPVGQDGGPVGLPTEAAARCWLLAYQFGLGIPAVPRRQGGEAS